MCAKSRVDALEILKSVAENRSMLLQNSDDLGYLLFRKFVADDYGRLYITM